MERELIMLTPQERAKAKESPIAKLKMAVWYDPDIPVDRKVGELLFKTLEAIGCNVTDRAGNPRSPEGLMGGQDITYATESMFNGADLVHIVLSNQAIRGRGRLFIPGLRGAYEASKARVPGELFVIPIKLDPDSMPTMFREIQPVNLYESDLKAVGERLLKTWQYAASRIGR